MDAAAEKIVAQAGPLSAAAAGLSASATAYAAAHAGAGLSLLDAQSHALLVYSADLARYAAARVRRDPQPALAALQERLAAGWAVLDRARPLEKAARPALQALLQRAARAGQGGVVGEAGKALRARPDPAGLVVDGEEEGRPAAAGGGEGEKVYRPPRIAEVVYDGEREALAEREEKARRKMSARAARSRSVREMLAEVSGAPDEVRDDEDEDGVAGRELARLRRDEEDRVQYEEENLTRLNVTREDKRRRRALEKAVERGGHGDGGGEGDAFADLMGVADRVIGKGGAGSKVRRDGQERVDALDALDRGLVAGKKKKRAGGSGAGGKKKRRR